MAMDIIARGLAAKGVQEADRANTRIDMLPEGMVYVGAVNYYKDLPSDANVGDVYTVKYTGESGENPSGSEYVYGLDTDTGNNAWIEVGRNYDCLPAQENGTDVSLVTTGDKYNWNNKQEALVNQSNIKSINGNSLLGSGNLNINTYQAFSNSWTTTSTTAAFCAAVNADASAIKGMAYLGELVCSDLPFVGNADAVVEVIDGTGTSGKVIHITITSGNVAPYRWEYTYWNNGSNVSGWIGYQPELPSGNNDTYLHKNASTGNLEWSQIDNTSILSNIAPAYNSTSTYALDDLVIYQGVLYRCTTAVTVAEAFDSSKWTATTIAAEINNILTTAN